MAIADPDIMISSGNPARPDPGADSDDGVPSSATVPRPQPAREPPGRRTPDKEGGAPVDELDLDGDGARRQ